MFVLDPDGERPYLWMKLPPTPAAAAATNKHRERNKHNFFHYYYYFDVEIARHSSQMPQRSAVNENFQKK